MFKRNIALWLVCIASISYGNDAQPGAFEHDTPHEEQHQETPPVPLSATESNHTEHADKNEIHTENESTSDEETSDEETSDEETSDEDSEDNKEQSEEKNATIEPEEPPSKEVQNEKKFYEMNEYFEDYLIPRPFIIGSTEF